MDKILSEKTKKLFIELLSSCKNDVVDKADIIRVGEEYGMSFNKRAAKYKIVDEIVAAGYSDQLYQAFQEFLRVPVWKAANQYGLNSDQLEKLREIGVITEIPKVERFYSRSNREYYEANTYPLSILDYDQEKLLSSYAIAYSGHKYSIRLETNAREEIPHMIGEFQKLFYLAKEPAIYEKRNQGFHTYFTVQELTHSDLEQNRFVAEVAKLKDEIRKLKEKHIEEMEQFKNKYLGVFKAENLFELKRIKHDYDTLKEKYEGMNRE